LASSIGFGDCVEAAIVVKEMPSRPMVMATKKAITLMTIMLAASTGGIIRSFQVGA